MVYFDDILIYSLYKEEYVHYLRSVLETLGFYTRDPKDRER